MHLTIAAILYASFLWWFSTGVIFFLNSRPVRTFTLSMICASAVLVFALYGLWASASSETPAGAFLAFTCGLAIWGWHTMSYYMGIITGPRRKACPPECTGWSRFAHALATSIYHEIAILATVAVMLWLTWGQPNTIGLWTFVVLWTMHVSAKLNVFLGVRNLNTDFIPQRLRYLTTYFRKRSMNLLFPLSVTTGTVFTILLVQLAMSAEPGTMASAGYVLLATLMALAVIEHWFMILPLPADALWRWSLKSTPVLAETSAPPARRTTNASVSEGEPSKASTNQTVSSLDPSARSVRA